MVELFRILLDAGYISMLYSYDYFMLRYAMLPTATIRLLSIRTITIRIPQIHV
jgi:hypothetical protein